ncbi:MAG: glycoside hydrolase family 2 TIM barrel-domain containing protein [Gammaproteobacteria bacterium]
MTSEICWTRPTRLAALAAAGANSVRTWGGDVAELLDEAHSLGLTVTVGIWLGHERHGFDYGDRQQLEDQLERAREMVLRYRDHPALLLWGIGNEMEGFEAGADPKIWAAVNEVAALVKSLDPHHPTMTVTAYVHGERIEYVHRRSPAVDIHGVNAYGGADRVPELLRAGGATKPYVLTEFGPPGPWEAPTTPWDAPYEPTSTQKAELYRSTYRRAVLDAPGLALGSYAFLWGSKMEGTDTWFGMLLADGAPTAAVDAMTELWSGAPPSNLAPVVEPLEVAGSSVGDPGQRVTVRASAKDPEGGPLTVRWALRPESREYQTGGDYRRSPSEIGAAILESTAEEAVVRLPGSPGPYRLFFYAYDQAGKAATANVPLLVEGERRLPMPFWVYRDGFEGMPWVPSGWMGGTDQLSLDGDASEVTFEGEAAIRLRYEGRFGWAGVAWQDPPNNWGEQDGGHDLRSAAALEVWARGEYGGEQVSFGVGLLDESRAHPDSAIARVDGIFLTRQWQRYEVPLAGLDLSSIKTGFVVTVQGRQTPVTVYLDSIRYVR